MLPVRKSGREDFQLPRLYAIVDADCCRAASFDPPALTQILAEAGVRLIQYRNKADSAKVILRDAREIGRIISGSEISLIMNDRADLCLAAGFDGVHLGQEDLSAAGARDVVGRERAIGLSTHSPEQARAAAEAVTEGLVDYIAIGPVFATISKQNPDPVIGLEGIRRARASTRSPLVAIGGITPENCCQVIEAGADSVAVISELLRDPMEAARRFLRILE